MSVADWEDIDDDDELDEEEAARCPECGAEMFIVTDRCQECGYWLSEADRWLELEMSNTEALTSEPRTGSAWPSR